MYYIVQKNVFRDPRYDEIFHVLDSLNLPYEEVIFYPNSNEFFLETDRKDVFVYGSVKLAKVCADFDWNPGSFYGGNHEYEKYAKGFGEYILNHGSFITQFSDSFSWEENQKYFIKPSIDAKVFTGKVFTESEWKDFTYETLNNNENTRITAETLIQVSKYHKIIKEARVWIVNQKVVTSSYYLFHDQAGFEENVSNEGLDFAQKMAKIYNVADAYVMDVCETFEGWKIVEVNCINSAGFYKGDVKKIILVLEEMYAEK
ncbi:ATP-grasp domain-containing protein [Aureivirga sp. CE67]|uniref:ATP-grasp domain-containing protein n=1 Tax=Aureivirga sp. CE67 TaxID=1788983 RepID=UPI0018CBA180|nr:ATP-grasp domain-containing protein [Aureivirga sp. CE67]